MAEPEECLFERGPLRNEYVCLVTGAVYDDGFQLR